VAQLVEYAKQTLESYPPPFKPSSLPILGHENHVRMRRLLLVSRRTMVTAGGSHSQQAECAAINDSHEVTDRILDVIDSGLLNRCPYRPSPFEAEARRPDKCHIGIGEMEQLLSTAIQAGTRVSEPEEWLTNQGKRLAILSHNPMHHDQVSMMFNTMYPDSRRVYGDVDRDAEVFWEEVKRHEAAANGKSRA
jgi:hypothetical protein